MAAAEERYAHPSGSGPASSCPRTNPCGIEVAVEDAAADDGDEVILLGGVYQLGSSSLDVANALDLHGVFGQPRPRLESSGDRGVVVSSSGAVLRHFGIAHGGAAAALELESGEASRIYSRSVGTGSACEVGDALIRNTVCWSQGAGAGLAMNAGSGAESAAVRNVTAFAQGDGIGVAADGGAAIEMDAVNTIAFGGSADVRASAGAGSSATVTLSSSNYSSAEPEGAGDASITAVGSGSNQTAEPIFVGAGDFRQASGSPTIDAGELDPQLGPSDLGGEPRMQGSGPDIGADEFPLFGLQEGSPPDDGGGGPNQGGGGGPGGGGPGAGSGSGGPRGTADRRAPNTRITKHPRKRVRRKSDRVRAAFRFVATERRSTFQCKLDRKRWRRCRAPYRAALRATRKPKSHIFRVRATDRAGNTDPSPARFRWKVKRRR